MDICNEAFYNHWILFPTVWYLPRLSQGRTRGKAKCGKKRSFAHENCQKPVTRHRYLAISQKWLKIGGYMLRGVWQALKSLSIHVIFTAIFPGTYPGEAKMCKNVLKLRTLDFTAWFTGKWLKIGGYMLRGLWLAFNSLSIHATFTAIVPGAYPGRPKCAKMC